MKIAAVADVHAHNPRRLAGAVERSLSRRCRDTLRVLERAYALAHREGCSHMLVLGDLVDSTSPEPQLIGQLLQIVHEARIRWGIVSILLVGNHDQESDQEGDHALAPFVPFGKDAIVVETPSVLPMDGFDLILLPHAAAPPAPKRLASLLTGLTRPSRPAVLGMHAGISDDNTPHFLQGSADSIDVSVLRRAMIGAGVNVTLAGNWHDRREWRSGPSTVIQVGALVPTGFDNPGLDGYGGVAVLDSSDMTVTVHTLEGPRFLPVSGLDALKELLPSGAVSIPERRVYIRVTVQPDEMKAASDIITGAHKAGLIVSGEVIPDGTDRVVSARKAASAARSASTLTDALNGFVNTMPLEEGVGRGEVLEKCRGFLKTGG